jgi:putative spermidine/putrescine transport system permease protein
VGDPFCRTLGSRRQRRGGRVMQRLLRFLWIVAVVTVCAFLTVPIALSVLAGLTVNYADGLSSGLTLAWVTQVWSLYHEEVGRSLLVAATTLGIVLCCGVPLAYVLAAAGGRFARTIEELVALPIAVPGLALALALIQFYGPTAGEFRRSWLFIVAGHSLFTLPFMTRSVLAVLRSVDLAALEEAAASLGAGFRQRFTGVVLPNVREGIVAGALMTFTLSIGEFNLTWLLHTPLTKTLPVGLADAYASMRLEIASAYTLLFFVMIVPVLVLVQWIARWSARRGFAP